MSASLHGDLSLKHRSIPRLVPVELSLTQRHNMVSRPVFNGDSDYAIVIGKIDAADVTANTSVVS